MKRVIAVILILILMLTACGDKSDGEFVSRFYSNSFDEPIELKEGLLIDLSNSEEGYFGVSISLDGKYKIQVIKDEIKYNYDLPNDGDVYYYPFTQGNGSYKITVMKNTSDTRYVLYASTKKDVELIDEFQPYLHSSYIVRFDEDSKVVEEASKIAAQCDSDVEVVKKVFESVCDRLSYDKELASSVQAGYTPVPDDVWLSKKGICYDYAALTCAMLRSQGIPCKLITGYYDNTYYHAWNMVYIRSSGWVVYGYDVDTGQWNLIDTTLQDSYNDSSYLEKEYTESYVY